MIKETNAPEETFAFGKMLGEQAKPGEVICLNGDLGVGKTVFTKGFAEGLGITEPVNSPTSRSSSSMTAEECRCIILMCTGSVTSARWMKSDMKTAFTGKA